MRNLILAVVAVGLLAGTQSADAQVVVMNPQPVPMVQQGVVVQGPVTTRTRTTRVTRRGSLMDSVIEFEKRKNAWFRRTFFGR